MIVFSALRIPKEAADAAEALSDVLRQRTAGSFPRQENYHITVHYFGEVNERAVRSLDHILKTHPLPELTLRFDHLLRFHGSRGDQIVYACRECPGLQEWQRELGEAYRKERFRFDKKEYRPHITLVRRKQGRIEIDDISVPAVEFQPGEPVLLESLQIKGQRIYRPVYGAQEDNYDD